MDTVKVRQTQVHCVNPWNGTKKPQHIFWAHILIHLSFSNLNVLSSPESTRSHSRNSPQSNLAAFVASAPVGSLRNSILPSHHHHPPSLLPLPHGACGWMNSSGCFPLWACFLGLASTDGLKRSQNSTSVRQYSVKTIRQRYHLWRV